MFILSMIFSPLSDYLVNNGIVTVGTARKTFQSIGHWIPMLALICLAYVTEATIAVFLLTIAIGLNAGTFCGYLLNHLDLSPNFSGTLMGITNSLSNVMSILGPLAVGFIVHGGKTKEVSLEASTMTI